MEMRKLASMLAIVATVATGCGSADGQDEYVDQVNVLQGELVDEVTATVSGAAPSTSKEAAAVADELEQVFNASADRIEAVTAPEEVADLHTRLVDEIRQIADQIARAEEAFTSGDAQEAAEAATDLQAATSQAQNRLNALIDQINAEFGD